jgi:hypothetical protein
MIGLLRRIIGGTAKSSKCGSLIVPVPAGAIGKTHRAENPRQVAHSRIRLEHFQQKCETVLRRKCGENKLIEPFRRFRI